MSKLVMGLCGLAVLYLLSGIHRVGPNEQAVVVRFGRVASIRGPGLWLSLPWRMDVIHKIETDRVRQVAFDDAIRDENTGGEGAGAQFVTADQNVVIVSAMVEYSVNHTSIDDGYLLQEQSIAEILRCKGFAGVSEWVARRNVDEVLLQGRSRLSLWLHQYLDHEIRRIGIGIIIHRVNVVKIAPLPEVQDSFDAVARAEIGMTTQIHDAERVAKQRTEEAKIEEYRLKQNSLAYRDTRLQAAKSESNAFLLRVKWLEEQGAGSSDAIRRIWWDTMGQLLGNMNRQGRIQIVDDTLNPKGLELFQVVPKNDPAGSKK